MSDSVRPYRWQPTRLPHPWDSPGKNTGVGCHFLLQCMKVKSESEVAQSCPTLSDPMDCSLPGSSVYGIFQARVLEWGALPSPDLTLLRYKFLQHQKKCICPVCTASYQIRVCDGCLLLIAEFRQILLYLCGSAGKESTCNAGHLGSIRSEERRVGK